MKLILEISIHWLGNDWWVPIKYETKRNETKSTKTKRNQRNGNEMKRNQQKQNEIDWYEENGRKKIKDKMK
jgi:hypothetical protein